MSPNARGALFMMASMAAFTFNDAAIKATGGDVPLFQLIFLRGLLTTALLWLIARATGTLQGRFTPRDRWLVCARVVTDLATVYLFLTALLHMPIANVTAILQALPLIVALAGYLFFGEPLGWRRLAAIALGFVGVMLIIRPGAADFSIYSVYALLAALFVAARDLVTRPLSRDASSMTVSLLTAAGITAFAGLASLAEPWVPITGRDAVLIVTSAVFIAGGYVFSVQTMRQGDLAFTALFRYTGILWALLVGLVFFGEWPDAVTLGGVVLVVATGGFTLWREGRLRRKPDPVAPRTPA